MHTAHLMAALFATMALAAFGQEPQVGGTPVDPAKARAQAVERAKAHLAATLKIPEKEIVLESAEETTWPDASLGCPEKGHMYAQMVTPGWTVVLTAQGRPHEIHVAGKRAVSCPKDAARGDAGR